MTAERSSDRPPASCVEPLAGFTVAVTAARRREELTALLERHGARVVQAPAIRIVPVVDDTLLRRITDDCLAAPVDVVIATTGIGFRGWLDAAEGWGLAGPLLARLAGAEILARGPKARGAVRASGLPDPWSPPSESSSEVLARLLARGVTGARIVVQLHGEPLPDFVDALRLAGADVVEISAYRWTLPADVAPLHRLIDLVADRHVDAVTFTSAPAVASVLRTAGEERRPALLAALREAVVPVCVGPITGSVLERAGVRTVQPSRFRLGALVRAVVDAVPASRLRVLPVAEGTLELRGHAAVRDGTLVPLPPTSMALLRRLAVVPGQVVATDALAEVLRVAAGGDAHAVGAAVGRLRVALGDARLVQTVTKRGYRLAYEPERATDTAPPR